MAELRKSEYGAESMFPNPYATPGALVHFAPGDHFRHMPYNPADPQRSVVCSYCGRFGTLHSSCAGCGAQVVAADTAPLDVPQPRGLMK